MSLIVTITGPTCAGKTTLEKMLKAKGFENAISTTTRLPRLSEAAGEAYFFISSSEFKRLKIQGAFAEHVEFNGEHYGISVEEITRLIALNKPIVIVCEPEGQKQIDNYAHRNKLDIYSVFIDNPTAVVCDRFLRRLAKGMFAGEKTLDENCDLDPLFKVYANRLAEMMTTEQEWVREAIEEGGYDLRVSRFDETNAAEVVAQICAWTDFEEKEHA